MIKFVRNLKAKLMEFWSATTAGQKLILLAILMVLVYAVSFQMGFAWAVNNYPF